MRPRFFFDLRRDGEIVLDDEGDELDSVERAEDVAIEVASSAARDQSDPLVVTVRDETGKEVVKVTLALTVEHPGRPGHWTADPSSRRG